jgi:hypothetical protein
MGATPHSARSRAHSRSSYRDYLDDSGVRLHIAPTACHIAPTACHIAPTACSEHFIGKPPPETDKVRVALTHELGAQKTRVCSHSR